MASNQLIALRGQQTLKPRLLKVTVARECLSDTALLHHDEAGAIDETPRLVLVPPEEIKCVAKQSVVHNNQFGTRISD